MSWHTGLRPWSAATETGGFKREGLWFCGSSSATQVSQRYSPFKRAWFSGILLQFYGFDYLLAFSTDVPLLKELYSKTMFRSHYVAPPARRNEYPNVGDFTAYVNVSPLRDRTYGHKNEE